MGFGWVFCICKFGFIGDGICCDDVDYCNLNLCFCDNIVGECLDGFGGWENYICNCKLGWFFFDCDVEINECCFNFCNLIGIERCEDIINGFICCCKLGFSGRFCEMNVNDCE